MSSSQTNNKPKFTFTTETDVGLAMLADPDKLKVIGENSDSSLSSSDTLTTSSDSDSRSKSTIKVVEDRVKNLVSGGFMNNIGDGDNIPNPSNKFKPINTTGTEKFFGPKITKPSDSKKVDTKAKNKMFMEQSKELPFDQLPPKVQKFKKLEKFAKLMHLKNNCGIKLTQDYSLNSKYEDMEFELQYHTNMMNKKKGVELWKSFISNGITAVEFMNDRFDPFGFKLNGWSEHIKVGIDDYDEVLGELYEKYKGKGKKVEPEIKLLIMIITSAATFHASKSLGDTIPGLDDVLKNNPDLIHKLNRTIAGSKKTGKDVMNEVNNYQRDLYDQMLQEKKESQHKINENEIENMKLKSENKNQKMKIDSLYKQNISNNTNHITESSGPKNLGDIIKKMKSKRTNKDDSDSSRLSLSETISSASEKRKRNRKRGNNVIRIAT
jgi:hypothetical protein